MRRALRKRRVFDFVPSYLKVIQRFQKYAKTFNFRQAFRQKNRLKIALQVSKLGFSPIVMP